MNNLLDQPLSKIVLRSNDHSPNFQNLSLSALTDYIIEVHHSYVRKNLPLLSGHLFKIATKHGDTFPYMKRVFVLFTQVRTELEAHLLKEDDVVFPLIKRLDGKDAISNAVYPDAPIAALVEEYEMVGTLMQKIRKLTNNYESPHGACTTFQLAMNALSAFDAELHKYVHLENNVLFPKVIARFENLKAARK